MSGVVNTGQVLILSVVYVKCSEYRSSLWYMSSVVVCVRGSEYRSSLWCVSGVVNTGQVCGVCQG